MDLFKPGLPKAVLRLVRSTNTISAKLVQKLNLLNEQTSVYLLTVSTKGLVANVQPGSLEDIFTRFYDSVGLGSIKVSHVPEIPLATLRKYYQDMTKVSDGSETHTALLAIVEQYAELIALHQLANSIIFKTIVSKRQLGYWSEMKLSPYTKACYAIQTLPLRAFRFAAEGVQNTVVAPLAESRLTRVVRGVWTSFYHMVSQMWAVNVNFIMRASRFRMLKVPLNFLDDEIKLNIHDINARLDDYYEKLGLIINNLSSHTGLVAQILGSESGVVPCLDAVEQYVQNTADSASTAPPGFFVRYWPLLAVLLAYGPSTSSRVWSSRAEIVRWLKLNLVDTMTGFWTNWIVRPVSDMLAILRNDDTMAISSKESLRSDLDSLDRMVVDFMRDNKVDVDPEQVHQAVSQGDLTMMMAQYEKELRNPYRLIVSGLLVRSILIQVQKTKVDGAVAINGIDKLLKSQQLLFGVLSILPSLFILYQGNRALHRDASLSPDVKSRRVDCLRSLNQVEKLVNRETDDDKLVRDGKVFVEIVNLTLLSRDIVPGQLRGDFLHDLNELAISSTETGDRASSAVNRVWNMYLPFFRRSLT